MSLESAIFEKIQFSIKASPSDDDVSTKIQCQIFLTLWTQNSEYLTGFYKLTLRGKCPYSNFFWSVFFRIRTEHRDTTYPSVFSPNAENSDQKNSEYRHFSCSVIWKHSKPGPNSQAAKIPVFTNFDVFL